MSDTDIMLEVQRTCMSAYDSAEKINDCVIAGTGQGHLARPTGALQPAVEQHGPDFSVIGHIIGIGAFIFVIAALIAVVILIVCIAVDDWVVSPRRRRAEELERKKQRELEEGAVHLSDEDLSWAVFTCEETGVELPGYLFREYERRRLAAEKEQTDAEAARHAKTLKGRVERVLEVRSTGVAEWLTERLSRNLTPEEKKAVQVLTRTNASAPRISAATGRGAWSQRAELKSERRERERLVNNMKRRIG